MRLYYHRKIRGFTLTELILAAVISVIAVSVSIAGYNFLYNQTKSGIGRSDINLQMDYALEKIRLHCLSASAIKEKFTAGKAGRKYELYITGEKDPYRINTGNTADKMDYHYYINEGGELMLSATAKSGAVSNEVLISQRYSPKVAFEYSLNNEPDYFTAAITATARNIGSPDTEIVKKEGVRFWYIQITQ